MISLLNTTHIQRLIRFLLVVPLFLLACNRAGEHEALFRQVESVMNKRPDSAMVLLETIQNPERLPERDWAYWALLTTQAKDKLYIRHTSDSVINRVVDYFDGFSFFRCRHEKALAYYYKGRVNNDLGHLEEALKAYHEAYDNAKWTDDYKLTYLIESNVGKIYLRQDMYHLALKAYENADKVVRRANDSTSMAYTSAYLGRVYGKQENWEQSKACYRHSIKISEQIGNNKILHLGIQELMAIYADQDSLDAALDLVSYLDEIERRMGRSRNQSTNLTIGDIYRKKHETDSAYFYLSQAISSNNIYTRLGAYQGLYYLYMNNQPHRAIQYNTLYEACQDSIAKMGSASDLYQVKEAHEAVKRQAVDMRRWFSAGAVVLALLVALGYFYYRYRTGRKRLERQVRDYEERSARQESEASRSAFVNSPLYSRFHDKHEIWTPTAEDWEALFGGVDSAYPGFSVALGESLPHLSLVERRLCYLVKIGVKPGVIARLLCCSDSAVSMYRKRLYEKATGQSGSAKDFDRYISEL